MAFQFSNEQTVHYNNPVDVHHFNPENGEVKVERLYVPGLLPREARYWALELVNHLNQQYPQIRRRSRAGAPGTAYLPWRTGDKLTDD